MEWKVFLCSIVLASVVSRVAAQDIVDERNTQLHGYHSINYSAVNDQFVRASQPSLWQRISSRRNNDTDRNFVVRGGFGFGYTQETNAMLAASVVGNYSLHRNDVSLPYSTTSLIGAASVNGSFRLAVNNDLLLGFKDRLKIYLGGGSMPVNFWGLGYEAADRNIMSKYVRDDLYAELEYVRRIVSGFSFGLGVDFCYASIDDVQPLVLEYLNQGGVTDSSAITFGVGLKAGYDGRTRQDSRTKGIFLEVCSYVHPKLFASQDGMLWHVEATANYHQPLWMGGELAFDLYADMWSRNTPWLFWPKIGGENRMRGYYYGRYIDRQMVTAQMELRQKIYKVLSGAMWVGAGSVFPSCRLFSFDKILPNYGVGMRVAVTDNLSFRIDYGFGRHSHGLIINVNEAF